MLKYKPGDKVVVREDMRYISTLRQQLRELNYILTIKEILGDDNYYSMEEVGCGWTEIYIIKLYEEFIDDPINSRFDIIDIR